MDIESEKLTNVRELLAAIPERFGFHLNLPSDGPHELRSDRCILQIAFERFEPSEFVLVIADPKEPRHGMNLWILRYLRGIKDISWDQPGLFRRLGTVLATNFGDLLNGDFSIRTRYDDIENRFFDRLTDVEALPQGHQIRVLYENYDLRWLTEIEKLRAGS